MSSSAAMPHSPQTNTTTPNEENNNNNKLTDKIIINNNNHRRGSVSSDSEADYSDALNEEYNESDDSCDFTAELEHSVDSPGKHDNKNINASAAENGNGDKRMFDNSTIAAIDAKNLDASAAKALPQLVMPSSTDAPMDISNDAYCPITPRCIMDTVDTSAEESKMNASLMKSASRKSIKSANAEIGDNGDPDDYDDEYEDEEEDVDPDDELLVQFLDEANAIAEARLAARRQARAEAREIRMRELERQQKEQEQNADRVFDMHTATSLDPLARTRLTAGLSVSSPLNNVLSTTRGNAISSRRSSEDSLEEEGRSLRDIRHELKDVEERFRKAMIANAQLDNERASQTYQIQLLKDKLEEMEESYAQLQREFKDKSRECSALKRNLDKVNDELKLVQGQLSERDQLISDQGLIIVAIENDDGTDAKRALVSVENAQLLGSVQGSLDVRLKKFNEEKQQLSAEVQQLQEQLDTYKSQGKGRGGTANGPLGNDDDYDAQREANKIISDYKYKLQKAEQEIASLQASLARSETQVIRYKSTAEAAEKAEAELKIERRKLQRENREAMERLEELETSNNHLLKRLDKLKNAKSALLKDL